MKIKLWLVGSLSANVVLWGALTYLSTKFLRLPDYSPPVAYITFTNAPGAAAAVPGQETVRWLQTEARQLKDAAARAEAEAERLQAEIEGCHSGSEHLSK